MTKKKLAGLLAGASLVSALFGAGAVMVTSDRVALVDRNEFRIVYGNYAAVDCTVYHLRTANSEFTILNTKGREASFYTGLGGTWHEREAACVEESKRRGINLAGLRK